MLIGISLALHLFSLTVSLDDGCLILLHRLKSNRASAQLPRHCQPFLVLYFVPVTCSLLDSVTLTIVCHNKILMVIIWHFLAKV